MVTGAQQMGAAYPWRSASCRRGKRCNEGAYREDAGRRTLGATGIPILRREEQHRPTITEAELVEILANTSSPVLDSLYPACGALDCQSKSSVNETKGRFYYGAPGAIRTPDLVLRRHTLYPAELRARRQHQVKTAANLITPF